jgi:hypothetical protein
MSLVSFNEIQKKLENGEIINFRINSTYQDFAEIGNTIITFIDKNGFIYNSEVFYNSRINLFFLH